MHRLELMSSGSGHPRAWKRLLAMDSTARKVFRRLKVFNVDFELGSLTIEVYCT